MKLKPVDFNAVAERGAFVYCYLRASGTPYYIGMATTAARPFERHTCGVPRKNKERVRVLRSGLTKEKAIEWEMFYIKHYGRKDIGTGRRLLWNLTDGGEGTANMSPEALKKRATWRRGMKEPAEWTAKRVATRMANGGFAHTAETKEKIRQMNLRRPKPTPEQNAYRIGKSTATRRSKAAAAWGITTEVYFSLTRKQRQTMRGFLRRHRDITAEVYLKMNTSERASLNQRRNNSLHGTPKN